MLRSAFLMCCGALSLGSSRCRTEQSCRKFNAYLLTHDLLTCLCRISKDMYPAQAASYSTFVPPYSYAAMFRLLQQQGLMQSNGLCHPDADLYNSFSCPPNTTKVSETDMPEHCSHSNVSACPQVKATSSAVRCGCRSRPANMHLPSSASSNHTFLKC